MNIQEATVQIENAVRAYLAHDELGLWRIPFHMQRPIIMLGPPGVGKTAVAAQVARELDVNFVSYSITHHTRQSALGLPYLSQEEFDGRECRVSDYTMSEIIAAVHRARRESGVAEGILFLDEVNCVSETLAPAMLQFLQYKTFGMHRLPEGWAIVCAGNPPEYNRSAREFDPATMDRLKRIDVEPDLGVWLDYAAARNIHPAVTSFLHVRPDCFYRVRATASGTSVVTARGWEDLSQMLSAYEAEGMEADACLVRQYLQEDEAASSFFAYYGLFKAYLDEYRVEDILDGRAGDALVERAREARFDERVAVVGLLLDAVCARVHAATARESALALTREDIVSAKRRLEGGQASEAIGLMESEVRGAPRTGNRANALPGDFEAVRANRLRILGALGEAVGGPDGASEANAFARVKEAFNAQVAALNEEAAKAARCVDGAFSFLDEAFGRDGQEPLILVTRLSADPTFMAFAGRHRCESYLRHNKSLLFEERGLDLLREIEALS